MKALYVKRVYIGYIVSSKQLKTAPLRVFYLLLRIALFSWKIWLQLTGLQLNGI